MTAGVNATAGFPTFIAGRPGAPDHRPRAVFLMGPTAVGKSRLAMALGKSLPIEIISVDSAQVYRGMDVGTAKPSLAERSEVPHHLIDIVAPTENYSVARFRRDALELINGIGARSRIPVLVGGTMLYFRSLLNGLSDLPDANEAIRADIDREAMRLGWPALHAVLAAIDPVTAARLAPNDSQRIQRAIEVHRATGSTLSQLLAERLPRAPEINAVPIALLPADRSALHRRIELRFDAMLKDGLVEELCELRARLPLDAGMPSMRCVGYRQAWQFIEGYLDRTALRERGIYATRQLAKRQMTWLRSWSGTLILDSMANEITDMVGSIERALQPAHD